METVVGKVKICQNAKRTNCVDGRFNIDLIKFMKTNEIVLSIINGEITIRKPIIDNRKTLRVQDKGTFSFEAAEIKEEIIGEYEAIDIGDETIELRKL